MASAAMIRWTARRYGSPPDVAAYLGLSLRGVRRLIAVGDLPSYAVGRRRLVAYADADAFMKIRRAPTMAIAPPASPHRSVDARGRALPLTAEELRRRAEEALRALDDVAAMGDPDEQDASREALLRDLDEDPL